MEVNRRRIIVIGLGSIGLRHARLLLGRDDLVVELCEPNEARLQHALALLGADIPVHETFYEALETLPESVVVATPHQYHAEQTIAALERDIHVLCEKPLSDNVMDGERMRQAADNSGRVLAVGFMLHFHPALQRLKALLTQGVLGKIAHIHCRVGSYITLVNSASRYQTHMEGALLLDYVHQPDLLNWLLERTPNGVYTVAAQVGHLEFSSNPNVLSLTCDYDDDVLATIHLNYIQMPERHEYEVVGERGWIHIDLNRGYIRHGRRDQQDVVEEVVTVDRDALYVAEHQAFIDAIDGKRPPESSATSALASQAVVDAALNSWRSRQRTCVAEGVCP